MVKENRSVFDAGLWIMCQRLNKRVTDLEALLVKVTDLLEALSRENQCHHTVISRWLELEAMEKEVQHGES